MKFCISALIFVLVIAAAIEAAPQSKTAADRVYSAGQAKRGEAAFGQNCASCHGIDLTGAEGGPALTGTEFSANWNGLTLNDLFKRVKSTMPQTAPGSLADKQYVDIIAFILFKAGFPAGESDLAGQEDALNQIIY